MMDIPIKPEKSRMMFIPSDRSPAPPVLSPGPHARLARARAGMWGPDVAQVRQGSGRLFVTKNWLD